MWSTLVKLCVKADTENKYKTLRRVKREVESNPKSLCQRTPTGATPLHFAVLSNQKYLVAYLLQKGSKANALNYSAETPLHYAAQIGNISIIRLLLKNRANINSKDLKQNSPYQWALDAGHNHVAEYLARKGATVPTTLTTKTTFDLRVCNNYQNKCRTSLVTTRPLRVV